MSNDNKIKEKIKERYGKIATFGNLDSCCMPPPSECCSIKDNSGTSALQSIETIGYNPSELASIPQSSILGVGCRSPTKCAHIKEKDVVVDLGSGAGIDCSWLPTL
jgi:arsenite methyltransferase